MADLVLLLKDREINRIQITKAETLIGRDSSNDLQIDNTGISRFHTRVIFYENNFYALDEGSGNGTYVNGIKITQQLLNDGDTIQLAKYRVRLEMESKTSQNYVAGSVSGDVVTESTVLYSTDEMGRLLVSEKKSKNDLMASSRMASFERELDNVNVDESGTPWFVFVLSGVFLLLAGVIVFVVLMHYFKH